MSSAVSSPVPALRFDNSFLRALPADPDTGPRRRQVRDACYSRVQPTPVAAPRLVACSRDMAERLDLSVSDLESPALVEALAGNRLLDGMDPYATCYGGHQFGNWAGQLGDGRAISLGELVNRRGERWELQLKGAGPTPYSRTADGRAVLRSSIRELVCSEAMHHLGVPTTRALSLVTTGEQVLRDMFYDGRPRLEPGAVVCRVAPSFLRFGHFEMLAARGETELLRRLADYTLAQYFPELGAPSPDTYLRWFETVCERTAAMVAQWMGVGFVHGVMNTDNMSVLGLTIDYGPYGWLDPYDPDFTPNTTDAAGRRYRYAHQPHIAGWNLARFGSALLPLVGSVEPLERMLNTYPARFERLHAEVMQAKLGLGALDPSEGLIEGLMAVLARAETDWTLFFRHLADVPMRDAEASDAQLLAPLEAAYYAPERLTAEDRQALAAWLRRYARLARAQDLPDAERRAKMQAANPKYIFRNYLAQLAIDDAEQGDFARVHELLEVLRRPYAEQPGKEALAEKRPEWARHRPGCSMLSCSS